MLYEQILTELKDNILTITLNRPDKMNAYTIVMSNELVGAFTQANTNDEVRCIVVTGSGKIFCAGADLSGGAKTFDISGGVPAFDSPVKAGAEIDWSDPQMRDPGGILTLCIFESLKPVIGAINGASAGIGSTMQLPMDIRLASTEARFGFVFTRRGVVPESCSSWFLPRLVGLPKALEWMITGRIFDAKEALDAGLISGIYEPEDLLPAAYRIAREIIDNTSAISVALTRQMLWRMMGADHPIEAHKVESRGFLFLGMSAEAREGIISFLEKRPPHFPGKVSKDMPAFFPWWEKKTYS